MIGFTMAIISITSVWLSDIKMGYCSSGWWLNKKFCCQEVSEEGEMCDEWQTWGGMEPFKYMAYIVYAVRAGLQFHIMLFETGEGTDGQGAWAWRDCWVPLGSGASR